MRPFPKRGIVPYEGERYRITNRYGDERSMFYSLLRNVPGKPSVVHGTVPHQRLLAAIADYAQFKIEDQVYIDRRFITFPIVQRKWSFKLGTVLYGITDNKRRVILVWKQQETLLEAARLHAQALGTPPRTAAQATADLDGVL